MRVLAIVSSLGLLGSFAALTYVFSKEPDSVRVSAAPTSEVSIVKPELDATATADDLRNQLRSNEIQLVQAMEAQAEQKKQLQSLATRLVALEASSGAGDATTVVGEEEKSENQEDGITEVDVERWIDRNLDFVDFDAEATESTRNIVLQSIAKAPGINLDDMQCGEGYCRAAFTHVNGDQPDVSQLLGAPPFVGEGFTVAKPDGRLMVYFVEQGKSFDEIRQRIAASPQ